MGSIVEVTGRSFRDIMARNAFVFYQETKAPGGRSQEYAFGLYW